MHGQYLFTPIGNGLLPTLYRGTAEGASYSATQLPYEGTGRGASLPGRLGVLGELCPQQISLPICLVALKMLQRESFQRPACQWNTDYISMHKKALSLGCIGTGQDE